MKRFFPSFITLAAASLLIAEPEYLKTVALYPKVVIVVAALWAMTMHALHSPFGGHE